MNDSRRDGRGAKDAPSRSETPHDPVPGARGDLRRPAATRAPARDDEPLEAMKDRMPTEGDAPELRPAVLGRLEGLGILTVVRDADGGLIDANGTWRPGDETSTLDELRETFPVGSVTTFAGTKVEGRDVGAAEDVSLQVVIVRHGEYEDYEGRVLRIVNFRARDPS